MRCLVVFLTLLLLTAPSRLFGQGQDAPHVVDYTIDVRLDATAKTLAGSERLVWTNPSDDAVPDLWFHLYLNAFRNDRSTFFRESGGQLRGDRMLEDGWGWTEVTGLTLADGTNLLPAARFEHPDDDNADDRTVLRVPLPSPVLPRGTLAMTITWRAKLPKVFARTGYAGDYFLVGQWFPKIAVYEPGGTRGRTAGGWNCHQFHANSEFYADFGRFQVAMTVPARFVVGATGRRVATEKHANGTTTYRYEQDRVHDFGWTADPRFVEVTDTFSASRDVTPEEYRRAAALVGRPVDAMRLGDVEIRLLMQPGRTPQIARYMHAAKLAIKWFGLWYGPYPYPTLTIVDPPADGMGSGGMEYPTFITAGTSRTFNYWPFSRIREPEIVVIHEYGHQYWYGLVANNEFEEAWLDEGFNSYSTGRVVEAGYGTTAGVVDLPGFRVSEEDTIRAQTGATALRFDKVRQPAWGYSPNVYPFFAYTKPELLLRTLESLLGHQTMARVMRTYQERWRYRHPSSDDFYAVVNEVSGRDLRWYFSQVVESAGTADYEVSSISTVPVADKPTNAIGRTAPAADNAHRWRSRVVVRRPGDVVVPVVIEVRYEDGRTERVTWDGRDRWTAIAREGQSPIVAARVDPDDRLQLDGSTLNNALRTRRDPRVALSWTGKWLYFVQSLLAGAGL